MAQAEKSDLGVCEKHGEFEAAKGCRACREDEERRESMGFKTGELPKEERNCEKHGKFVSENFFKDVWTKCPKCAEEAKELEKRDEPKRASREAIWGGKLNVANIPERFKSKTLENFIPDLPEKKRVLDDAIAYAASVDDVLESGKSLIFIGGVGAGKTHISVGIAQEFIKRGKSVKFSRAVKIVRRIRDSWRKESKETEEEAIMQFASPDLLIMDEVGVQYGTEAEQLLIFEVMNERYERRKPTILLSNLDKNGVEKYIGARAFDRLKEGGGEVWAFGWGSYRGNIAK